MDLPRRSENSERDWQIEASSVLSQGRRRKIHHHPRIGEVEPCRPYGRTHTFAGLLNGQVRQADDTETRQSWADIHFDVHGNRLDAQNRRGADAGPARIHAASTTKAAR
jgi:hypothetical protein